MDLRTYEGRLQTFENWPTDHPLKPESLARAGQYYTGEAEEKDETSCYLCRGRLRDWEAGDDPYEEHKSNYPECPLSKQPALQVMDSPHGSVTVSDRFASADQREIREGISNISIGDQKVPPQDPTPYDNIVDRHQTFDWRWPEHLNGFFLEQNLAGAGFIFTGIRDRVRCFSCGLELENWKKDDIPYNRHVNERPECEFIRNIELQLEKDILTYFPTLVVPPDYGKMPAATQTKQKKTPLKKQVSGNSMCILCKKIPKEVLFEPCCHFVVCETCSAKCSHCPACGYIILKKSKYKRDDNAT